MRDPGALFRPFAFKALTLRNRIVMAPMTRYFSPGGIPGADVAAYYRRRAELGCGLIITEGTTVESPVAGGYQNVPHFWGKEALAGWRCVVEDVHEAGGAIIPQLWHVGMQRDPAASPNPHLAGHGPSGLGNSFAQLAEPMTLVQIRETIAAFARSAGHARELGFDGVQVHGAHGYLIDQFLWARTNLRADGYGGEIEERVRFAVEMIEAIRREVGPDFPVLLRLSQWKAHDYRAKLAADPDDLKRFLVPLVEAGVDIFDCSQRRFWEPEFDGSSLNLAGWAKRLTGCPSITVGSVSLSGDFITGMAKGGGSPVAGIDDLIERLETDEFDLVAVGRALLSNPDWAIKVRDGRYSELVDYSPEVLQELV